MRVRGREKRVGEKEHMGNPFFWHSFSVNSLESLNKKIARGRNTHKRIRRICDCFCDLPQHQRPSAKPPDSSLTSSRQPSGQMA